MYTDFNKKCFKLAAHLLISELPPLTQKYGPIEKSDHLTPGHFADIVVMLAQDEISFKTAKHVMEVFWRGYA